jgi:peptide/nickel transport system permease protein
VTVQLVTSIGLTLKLAAISIVIAMLIGIPMGIVAAVRQYSIFDNVVMFLGMIGMSMPIFWLALLLIILFSVNLGWFPSSSSSLSTRT